MTGRRQSVRSPYLSEREWDTVRGARASRHRNQPAAHHAHGTTRQRAR